VVNTASHSAERVGVMGRGPDVNKIVTPLGQPCHSDWIGAAQKD